MALVGHRGAAATVDRGRAMTGAEDDAIRAARHCVTHHICDCHALRLARLEAVAEAAALLRTAMESPMAADSPVVDAAVTDACWMTLCEALDRVRREAQP